MKKNLTGMTLIELIVALVLMSVVILGVYNIEIFGRTSALVMDRRGKAQSEAAIALEHIAKRVSGAIGNVPVNGATNITNNISIGVDPSLRVFIDANGNGRRDATPNDRWIAYRLYPNSILRFCPQFDIFFGGCTPLWSNIATILATNITMFKATSLIDNCINVTVRARWNAALPVSSTNPEVNLTTTIRMPSVSTN